MESFYGDTYYWAESDDPERDITHLLRGIRYSTLGVIMDREVAPFFSDDAFPGAAFVDKVDGGEHAKTFANVAGFMSRYHGHLDKDSVVVIAGGGSVLDLYGLCCGLLYRGVRYVSVPTTLIAMADAAYGGKTAVSYAAKNQIGMYHHPERVYANAVFLRTLPDLHMRSGMIEIAKLAVFFDDVRTTLADLRAGRVTVPDAARLAAHRKLQLLEVDPLEQGAASVLVYGHPFSNAFEAYTRHRDEALPHGAAVALGIAVSAWLSDEMSGANAYYDDQISLVGEWFDLTLYAREATPTTAHELLHLLAQDKYMSADAIRVPGLYGSNTYTAIPASRVSVAYDDWRKQMLYDAPPATTHAKPRRDEYSLSSSAYIAGRPTDETVAPLRIAMGDGPFLITAEGRRLLDWSACLNAPFGHSYRLDTSVLPVNAGNYRTDPRDALVVRLQELFPALDGFQFRSSGTEAVEAGLRYLAAAFGSAPHVVTVEQCYHGLTLGARMLMGTADWDGPAGRTELSFSGLADSATVLRELEPRLRAGPVAIWLEGVQGATLRRLPLAFLELLSTLQEEFSGRLAVVADDMLASIRCGDWCSITPPVTPDLLIGGKSWASGYPFSFFGIVEWLRVAGGDILGTTSYGGNPVACAHALDTIDRCAQVLPRIREIQTTNKPKLAARVEGLGSVTRSEWHGLLFGCEMRSESMARAAARRAVDHGLLVSQLGSVIRCSPPLDISDDLLEWGLLQLVSALAGDV